MAARIVVPPDMAWWYYQEFGTTGPYPIDPKDPNRWLKLPPKGMNDIYWKHVEHPGVEPKLYITEIEQEILQVSADLLARGLIEGNYSSAYCAEVLNAQVMPTVRDMIAESMRNHLNASREDGGQLKGQEPADVFIANATIVPIEEE